MAKEFERQKHCKNILVYRKRSWKKSQIMEILSIYFLCGFLNTVNKNRSKKFDKIKYMQTLPRRRPFWLKSIRASFPRNAAIYECENIWKIWPITSNSREQYGGQSRNACFVWLSWSSLSSLSSATTIIITLYDSNVTERQVSACMG